MTTPSESDAAVLKRKLQGAARMVGAAALSRTKLKAAVVVQRHASLLFETARGNKLEAEAGGGPEAKLLH